MFQTKFYFCSWKLRKFCTKLTILITFVRGLRGSGRGGVFRNRGHSLHMDMCYSPFTLNVVSGGLWTLTLLPQSVFDKGKDEKFLNRQTVSMKPNCPFTLLHSKTEEV